MSNWFLSAEAEAHRGLTTALEYLKQRGVFFLLGLVQMKMTLELECSSGVPN